MTLLHLSAYLSFKLARNVVNFAEKTRLLSH